MAREAVVIELYGQNNSGDGRRFYVPDNVSIAKGTLCLITNAPGSSGRVASEALVYTTSIRPAGIASMDKTANDGSTSITLWTNGIFNIYTSGALTIGDKVKLASSNYVIAEGDTTNSAALTFGVALKTVSTNEVVPVRINL